MTVTEWRKAFIPLESNPDVFNELSGLLGAPPELAFEDVFTLDEPALLPHPALALILVFPYTTNAGSRTSDAHKALADYEGCGKDEPVVWFKQTIHNACGLYAVLHALSNGEARKFLKPESLLDRLLQSCEPLPPAPRALALEDSAELEEAHAAVAVKGDSVVPESAEADVDFHYICFVKSEKDGHIYELDGDWRGPIDTGVVLAPGEDVLGAQGTQLVRDLITNAGGNINFNLLALVKKGET